MEHIVQFGITIDDDKIEKMLIENASKECMKQIEKATSEYVQTSYWDNDCKLKRMFAEEVKKVVAENKDKIIDGIICEGAKNILKTKAYKEAFANVVDSATNN